MHLSIENPTARAPNPDQLPLLSKFAPGKGAPGPCLNRANSPAKVLQSVHSGADNVTSEEGLDAYTGQTLETLTFLLLHLTACLGSGSFLEK